MRLEATYEVISRPAYSATLDDFKGDNGEQMVLMHIEVEPSKFSKSVMQQLIDDWSTFRSVTDAPLYGIEPSPDDDKWERFVSLLGFQNTNSRVDCTDGQTRRLFVSLPTKDIHHERQQHSGN
jgi:hypothetical protein